MNDSAHLMILRRKLKKRNNTPLNRLCVLSYMYSLFTSETKNNVRRQTMQPTQNSAQTQNIDDDLQFMLEYYNESKNENSMEIQMLDHGVSWSDFL